MRRSTWDSLSVLRSQSVESTRTERCFRRNGVKTMVKRLIQQHHVIQPTRTRCSKRSAGATMPDAGEIKGNI